MFATVFFVIGDWLTAVSNYPFSLSWSEGNRFWDYSIMYGMDRYINPSGKTVVPFLEAGRQFLWAIPFVIPTLGIRGMRLWNVIIWVVPSLLLGWTAIFRRVSFRREWIWQIGFGLWCFLFLSQWPIYPHWLSGFAVWWQYAEESSLCNPVIAIAVLCPDFRGLDVCPRLWAVCSL